MIVVWDVKSGQTVQRVVEEERDGFLFCSFSPNGKAIAAAMGFPARSARNVFQVGVFGVMQATRSPAWTSRCAARHRRALHPDGSLLASCTADGAVILWDVGPWRPTMLLPAAHRLPTDRLQS